MINLWLMLRDDAEAELQSWLTLEGLSPEQIMVRDSILSHPDTDHIAGAVKRRTDAEGFTWGLYSLYLHDTPTTWSNLSHWLTLYEGKAEVAGAWEMDGRQCGTERDAEGNLSGTPAYPIPDHLIEHMPDDVAEDGTTTTATGMKQINLLAGQASRDF